MLGINQQFASSNALYLTNKMMKNIILSTMNHSYLSKVFDARISRYPQDAFGRWYWDLSFTARFVVYITVLGSIMIIIFLILKFLSDCDMEADTDTLPVVVEEETPLLHKVTENRDVETASFSSSEDVDYSTLCVICFEERRNCFFVPCGHSATCQGCAQKILSEESKVCPICRRVIRKSRRLLLRL